MFNLCFNVVLPNCHTEKLYLIRSQSVLSLQCVLWVVSWWLVQSFLRCKTTYHSCACPWRGVAECSVSKKQTWTLPHCSWGPICSTFPLNPHYCSTSFNCIVKIVLFTISRQTQYCWCNMWFVTHVLHSNYHCKLTKLASQSNRSHSRCHIIKFCIVILNIVQYYNFPSLQFPFLLCMRVCVAVDEVMAAWGWQEDGDMVYIQNQEELIKPKKILAKIELDSELLLCVVYFPLLLPLSNKHPLNMRFRL